MKRVFVKASVKASGHVKQKIHIVRDAKDFEYSRGLCGSRSRSSWALVNIPEVEQCAVMISDDFCSACRAVVDGQPFVKKTSIA